MKQTKQVLIITGASSGIGKATATMFAKKGYIVYGVARRDFNMQGVNSVLGDVTHIDDVKRIVEYIIKREGKIDILINNAGSGISGSVEFTDSQDIKNMFEVNFMGAVNFTQQVLPIFRRQGYGKIINTSSVASFIPLPYQAFYTATKAALDGYAKALRGEVRQFNIKVCNVLPGDIKTEFTANRKKSVNDKQGVYAKSETKSIARMEHDEQNGMSPDKVAKVFYKISRKKNPPAHVTVGFSYKLIAFLAKVLPERFVLWIVNKLYG